MTSSEITPSGWEEVEPEAASELPELSEPEEPTELLPLSILPELLEVSEEDVLEDPAEGPIEVLEEEEEEEIEELLVSGFLQHPAKATAKTAATAINVFFMFKLPRFEDDLPWKDKPKCACKARDKNSVAFSDHP